MNSVTVFEKLVCMAAKFRLGILGTVTAVMLAATGMARADVPYVFTGIWAGIPYGYGNLNPFLWPTDYWYGPYHVGYGYGYGYGYGFVYPRIPTYGAIAYSPAAKVGGFAWGQPSLAAASSQAENFCGAADCRAVVWVQGGCAAISTSPVGNALGWAYASTKMAAATLANRSCLQSGGRNCQPRGWVCSF